MKVNIIQGIDRKLPLQEIAKGNELTMDDLLDELDAIVASGTRVNLDYYIEDTIDEPVRDEIYDFFMESESDAMDLAYKELKDEDITYDEIRLVRIKFLSEMAN